MATTLKVGDPAPDFTLPSNLDRDISLSEFRGTKKVLLIFYPLDFSPVCSVQLPDYQKRIDAFPEDVQLLGISRDSVFS
ncbi:MAG: peroxiredoxin, partial [Deltaproteobacteria bacterium]